MRDLIVCVALQKRKDAAVPPQSRIALSVVVSAGTLAERHYGRLSRMPSFCFVPLALLALAHCGARFPLLVVVVRRKNVIQELVVLCKLLRCAGFASRLVVGLVVFVLNAV